jgi:hypothetical protein
LEAQRARAGSREIDPSRDMREQYKKLAPNIKQLIEGSIISDRLPTSYATEQGTLEGADVRLTVRPFDSNMELLSRKYADAHSRLALAAPGSIEEQKIKREIAQLEESAKYQQAMHAQRVENAQAEHDANIAGMVRDAALIDERQSGLTINARRARYGLDPLGSTPAAVKAALSDDE